MDRFFTATNCDRCHKPFPHGASILSKYNLDQLCLPCKSDEERLPSYKTADSVEVAAVRGGDYNFVGIGLTDADRAALVEMRQARSKPEPSAPCVSMMGTRQCQLPAGHAGAHRSQLSREAIAWTGL